ncbi:PKD domain-containing protein [Bernardetia sp.]|uniref:PKD domain-containing protein n=1 Tax=Bernardetia sp. TaxID=1937974 RepID=UPI0025BB199B|nr:PKD domain-containing protein [Bernardetia sp.]
MTKITRFFLFALVSLVLFSCKEDEEVDFTNGIPVADFSYSPEFPKAGQTVTFTNKSENADTYQWKISFTAGVQIFASTDKELTYVFDEAEDYTVDLIVTNSSGAVSSTSDVIHVVE